LFNRPIFRISLQVKPGPAKVASESDVYKQNALSVTKLTFPSNEGRYVSKQRALIFDIG